MVEWYVQQKHQEDEYFAIKTEETKPQKKGWRVILLLMLLIIWRLIIFWRLIRRKLTKRECKEQENHQKGASKIMSDFYFFCL